MSDRAHKPLPVPMSKTTGRRAKPLRLLDEEASTKSEPKTTVKNAGRSIRRTVTESPIRSKVRVAISKGTKLSPAALHLPAAISSPQDLGALILELQTYARWASHANVKLKLKQDVSNPPPTMSPTATEMLHLHSWANDGQPLDASACEQLIHDLIHIKATAPTVSITLAAPATKQVKTKLVDWCRKNIDPGVLVNFQFNGTLLGGMVVRYGSHIFDWSFRRQLMDNRGNFGTILRKS